METLGYRIRKLRRKSGKTQQEMAISLDMGRANFSHIENDRVEPSTTTLNELADLLYTTTDYLLGRTDEPFTTRFPPDTLEWKTSMSDADYIEYFKNASPSFLNDIIAKTTTLNELANELHSAFEPLDPYFALIVSHKGREDIIVGLETIQMNLRRLKITSLEKETFDREYQAYFKRDPYAATHEYEEFDIIPVVGKIFTGKGLLAEENIIDRIFYPTSRKSQPDFALRVLGNSMAGAGIIDGDIVYLKRAKWAEYNGQIVAALIDGESGILRRMKWTEGSPLIELTTENDEYDKITIFPNEIQVCGVYMGLFRPE
jgi:SOS-response transcriptional repressor LexA/DNA-binding XRE family transcriptional regulator